MKRIGAGIAVILVALTLVTPPTAAQNGSAWLAPESPEPLESDGEVVLTVSLWRAGRVAYRTIDGACQVTYSRGGSPPDANCSGDKAHAPQDYTATSGELVFTEGGSKTITIPIIEDHLSEGDESFTLAAWEEVNADPWIDRGDSVVVRIVDDERGSSRADQPVAPTAMSTSDTTPEREQSSGSAEGVQAPTTTPGADVTVEPATPTRGTPASRNLEAALPAGDLHPGPGFELTTAAPPEPAPARDRAGAGSRPWLAIGLGTTALGVVVLAIVQRRRRWSPTQA